MCNDYSNRVAYRDYIEAFSHIRLPMLRPGPAAAPNLEAKDEIWPTDLAAIVRRFEEGVELVMMRWGWAPARPKIRAVINLRSEGRAFPGNRCLVPASHYYEFTGRGSPKTRWRFTMADEEWFCFAGLIGRGELRDGESHEAFALLTTDPGSDVAPYHDRQPVVLKRPDWAAWLEATQPAEELLRPSPAGSLRVVEAPREPALAL